MRNLLRLLFEGIFWGLTACLTVMEILFAVSWLRGTLYVMSAGIEDNPYAAEEAEIAGICALYLLPLLLVALVCGMSFLRGKRKK